MHISNLEGDKASATSELLNKLLQPAFYDQIRTQEQLSYSPFTASFKVNKQIAFGLFTQSPAASNSELYARFNAFLVNFESKLAKTTEQDFEKIKAAHIANYTAKPTSLNGEFSYLSNEWLTMADDINHKEKYIEALKAISLKEIKAFYQDVLISSKNKQQVLVQVQGQKFINSPLLTLEKQILIHNIDKLEK